MRCGVSQQLSHALLTTANFAANFAVDDCQCDFSVCSSHRTPDGAADVKETGPAATISSSEESMASTVEKWAFLICIRHSRYLEVERGVSES